MRTAIRYLRYLVTLLLAGLCLTFAYLAYTEREDSQPFQYCIRQHAAQDAKQPIVEAFIPVSVRQFVAFRCTWDFVSNSLKSRDHTVEAIATVVIAFFTWTLWGTHRAQLRDHRDIQRAYIWGGGGLNVPHSTHLSLGCNNYGKTPGLLTEYAVGVCPSDKIPWIPRYNLCRTTYHDWIRPVPERNHPLSRTFDISGLANPLIYGRFWFRDVWGGKHSVGFVLVTVERPTFERELRKYSLAKVRDTSGAIPPISEKRLAGSTPECPSAALAGETITKRQAIRAANRKIETVPLPQRGIVG